MNKEIEKILQSLKEHTWLEYEEMDKLLDYITNLQEENKKLKQIMLAKQFPDMNAVKVEIETDKQRINKAIDDIEFCLISIKQEEKMSTDERTRIEMESCKRILEELLDILKGEK